MYTMTVLSFFVGACIGCVSVYTYGAYGAFIGFVPLIVARLFMYIGKIPVENGTPEETEEEATGPLQIKQQTALCSADYYIKGGTGDKEEDRKRKNIGIGEKITFLLVGKPKGAIKELKWNIEGNGFKQVNTEQLQGELKIALTAKDDLEKDATAKIKAETSEGQKAEITINIRIPKKLKKEKFEGIIDLSLIHI